ncbi:hypothetical protein M569_01395, partial [Genlisea aurea]
MDSRQGLRGVIDPRFRRVGFFSQTGQPRADPTDAEPVSDISPASNSMSPVMIPPPRYAQQLHPFGAAESSSYRVGSYKQSEFLSPSIYTDNSDDLEQSAASSPSVLFTIAVSDQENPPNPATGNHNRNQINRINSRSVEAKKEKKAADSAAVKPLKEKKTTKAERRAIQEAQRAAKAAAVKGNKNGGINSSHPLSKDKEDKKPSSSGHQTQIPDDKDKKKEVAAVPPPRMQFDDDENKAVVKSKKRAAVIKQVESRNTVEPFRHLPQYEREKRLPELESDFFRMPSVHPAVYEVGMRYLAGDITDCNARCIAMLRAFQEGIRYYSVPPGKNISRDLMIKISSYVSYLVDCRPLSVSMGNAIRFFKAQISSLTWDLSETETKARLVSEIDHFITHKIILAEEAIVNLAATKISNGDVILTYGISSAVEKLLLHAHEEVGKQFRVIVVDSRPKLEGRLLLRRLVGKGISCTYTLINAISYVIREANKVFLGASSALCNGTVYSSVGSASVAMVAHRFHVPVLVCCESYKFHERVQLDSICSNELGDPNAVVEMIPGRQETGTLKGWEKTQNLQILNLIYDLMPPDFVSAIITEYGMIPPTSVPVIVREHGKEQIW